MPHCTASPPQFRFLPVSRSVPPALGLLGYMGWRKKKSCRRLKRDASESSLESSNAGDDLAGVVFARRYGQSCGPTIGTD